MSADANPGRFARWRCPHVAFLVVPAVLFLAVFYVYPLGRLALVSVDAPNFTLQNYVTFFTEGVYVRVLLQTFRVAASVTFLCLLLGYPTAYVLARANPRLRTILLLLVLIPYLTSFLVRTYAWMILLHGKGIINSVLLSTGVIDQPVKLIFNQIGVHIGMVHVMLPLMILPLFSIMRGIDFRLVTAAQSLGAGPVRAFWRVFFPLSLPGVRSGCLLVFLLSLGFYITPALLGGLRDVMLATFIEVHVTQLVQWGFAAAAAFILLILTLVGFFVVGRLTGAASLVVMDQSAKASAAPGPISRALGGAFDAVAASPPARALRAMLGGVVRRAEDFRWRARDRRRTAPVGFSRVAVWLVAGLVLLYLILPTFIVVPISFSSASFLRFPPPGFSLRWYDNFFGDMRWLGPTLLSLQIALATAILSTVLGTLAAYGLVRGRFRQRELVMSLIVSPIIVPSIVIAVALYGPLAKVGLIGQWAGIVVGHSIGSLAYVVVIVTATLANFDVAMERASMSLGAGPLRTFWRVTFPLIRPGIISGAIFAFIHSFDELVITMLISGIHTQTLPMKMWENMRNEIDPTIAAVASLLILLPIVVLGTLELTRGRGKQLRPGLV
ncbi:MAG: ABC transporter permease subunit [Alphaproteobacteria bacterium]|nr:ABC transporter permease subunit [Alphaproteobacteria bacterium]